MTEHPEITVLMHARSPFDAQVVAGVLHAAGIPCYVGGSLLQDPVAVSRATVDTGRVKIEVPVDRIEDARQALRQADEASHLLDDPGFDPGEKSDDV